MSNKPATQINTNELYESWINGNRNFVADQIAQLPLHEALELTQNWPPGEVQILIRLLKTLGR